MNFSCSAFRQFRNEKDSLRNFVVRQAPPRILSQVLLSRRTAVAHGNKRNDAFPVNRIRRANNASLENVGVLIEDLLYFLRRYIGAAMDDDFFLAPFEPKVAVRVACREVAGM